MNLGRYEIESYTASFGTYSETRQRIIYIGINEQDRFIERYYGDSIRDGYSGVNLVFTNLEWTDIKTHVLGESIVVNDKTPQALIYLTLASIESIRREQNFTLLVIDSQSDAVRLRFVDEFNYNQAYSLLNYILQNPDQNVNSFTSDTTPPTIFFYEQFWTNDILLQGNPTPNYWSTDDGLTFSVELNWSSFTGPKPITKSDLIDDNTGLVYTITDNREGQLSLVPDYISIYENALLVSNLVSQISSTGSYVVKINLRDLGQNLISPTIFFEIS